MSTPTASEPTLTEALLARGFSHRSASHGAHEIVRISDGCVMTTVKASAAWEYVHAFDRQVAKTRKPRLTRAQAASVRSLIDDSGYTRAEADAWVRAFEPGDVDTILAVTLSEDLTAAGAK